MPLSVLIADDHEVIRAGIRSILQDDEVSIVGEATTGREALRLVKKHSPDVVLLDIRMPEGDGLDCLARVKVACPTTQVVMFSSSDNPTYYARALALGASGYLLKSAKRKEICEAIYAAGAGKSLWSKEELLRISGGVGHESATGEAVPLTKREGEVLKQLALGLTNKEIASALGISYETVKEHVQHILRKLAVTDRTQAAVWAVRNSLV